MAGVFSQMFILFEELLNFTFFVIDGRVAKRWYS
jgi:hypothetical protein